VIKLEKNNVRLTAVDTRMGEQVILQSDSIADAVGLDARCFPADVLLAVLQVVLSAVLRVALAAMVLPFPRGDRAKREVSFWLPLVAHAAETQSAPSSSVRVPRADVV